MLVCEMCTSITFYLAHKVYEYTELIKACLTECGMTSLPCKLESLDVHLPRQQSQKVLDLAQT